MNWCWLRRFESPGARNTLAFDSHDESRQGRNLVKKVAFSTPMLICLLAALAFSQSGFNSDPFVKLNPSGPQTITSGPLNIIAAPDNPGLQCNLCLRDVSTPTWNGGSEFESFSHSAIVGNFAHHLFANYWAP